MQWVPITGQPVSQRLVFSRCITHLLVRSTIRKLDFFRRSPITAPASFASTKKRCPGSKQDFSRRNIFRLRGKLENSRTSFIVDRRALANTFDRTLCRNFTQQLNALLTMYHQGRIERTHFPHRYPATTNNHRKGGKHLLIDVLCVLCRILQLVCTCPDADGIQQGIF